MRKLAMILTLSIVGSALLNAQAVVKQVKGSVEVRRGVSEEWTKLKAGESLTPDNTIKTAKNSSLTLLIPEKQPINISELTLLDVGDLRKMTSEDLLLRLAMVDIRAIPPSEKPGEPTIATTTIIHGKDFSTKEAIVRNQKDVREMEVKGTRVLFDHGFYGTCALRAKEMLQVYPELKEKFEFRMMIAGALERSKLRGQALNEYLAFSAENLSPSQKAKLEENVRRLKQ